MFRNVRGWLGITIVQPIHIQHVRWCGHPIYVNSDHYVSPDTISSRSDQDSIATQYALVKRQVVEEHKLLTTQRRLSLRNKIGQRETQDLPKLSQAFLS